MKERCTEGRWKFPGSPSINCLLYCVPIGGRINGFVPFSREIGSSELISHHNENLQLIPKNMLAVKTKYRVCMRALIQQVLQDGW